MEKTSSEPASFPMRNDFVKAVHGALLHRIGVEGAIEFWAAHPLSLEGQQLSPRALGEHIWNERGKSPAGWMMTVANSLEAFLLPRGIGVESFHESIRSFGNGGSFVNSRQLLSWLGPILRPLFRFGDPYRLLLQGARLVFSQMSTECLARIVPRRQDAPCAGLGHATLWVSFPGLMDGSLPSWDFPVQTGSHIVASPRLFGLPPYQSLTPVCDARLPEQVAWQAACRRTGDHFLIDGEPYGTLTCAEEFLRAAGYDPAQLGPALCERQVVVIQRDYHCPLRKRIVLHAGCAYGATGYLTRLSWARIGRRSHNLLAVLHTDIADEPPWRERVERLHVSYLEAVTETVEIAYFTHDDSISVAGRHLCRGVQARILLECARIATREGRWEFSFRELKRRPDLVTTPKQTGFETRLLRLRQALAKAQCGLRLELTSRGFFRIEAAGRIQLRELGPSNRL